MAGRRPYAFAVIWPSAIASCTIWGVTLPGDDIRLPDTEIEFLERNAHVIYPLLAVAVLALLVFGIFRAWRSSDIDVETKKRMKQAILTVMRANVHGVTADDLAKGIELDHFKTLRLLEEMQRDGIVVSHTTTKRLTMWRLRGIGAY